MFNSKVEKLQPLQTYLLGYPIKASLAPSLHNILFRQCDIPWEYSLMESKDQQDLVQQIPQPTTIGAAVTMPHKINFTERVHFLTPEAAMTGAVNTVFFRRSIEGEKLWIGTNTDTIGVREAFLRNSTHDRRRSGAQNPALIIGGGGAARAAIYALHKWMGVSKIYLINRFAQEVDDIQKDFASISDWSAEFVHVTSIEMVNCLTTPFLVVSTVPDYPAATPAEEDVKAMSAAFLLRSEKGIVLEMCYMPRVKTSFYQLAEKNNWEVISGIEAMIWQGVAQQVLWTEGMDPSQPHRVEVARDMVRMNIAKIQH